MSLVAIWFYRQSSQLTWGELVIVLRIRKEILRLLYLYLSFTINRSWHIKSCIASYFTSYPRSPLKIYYMCQCGFYIYSITAILTWETQRKDFAVMFSHHVITVFLIGCSYLTRSLII